MVGYYRKSEMSSSSVKHVDKEETIGKVFVFIWGLCCLLLLLLGLIEDARTGVVFTLPRRSDDFKWHFYDIPDNPRHNQSYFRLK